MVAQKRYIKYCRPVGCGVGTVRAWLDLGDNRARTMEFRGGVIGLPGYMREDYCGDGPKLTPEEARSLYPELVERAEALLPDPEREEGEA